MPSGGQQRARSSAWRCRLCASCWVPLNDTGITTGDVIGSNAPRQLSLTGDFTQNPLAGLGNYFPPANFFWRIVRNSFCWSSVIARSRIGKNEIGDGTGQRRDPPLPSL